MTQSGGISGGAPRSAKLRPILRDTKFVKLRAMVCFKEVHQRLLEGWQLTPLVSFIQQERNEYTDIEPLTLLAILQEYRDAIPPATLVRERMPTVFSKAEERIRNGLDELAEMEDLYRLQMKRIDIDFQTEKKINKLLPSMTQEIRAAREVLKSIADLKMDLGLAQRHLGQVDVNAHLSAGVAERYGSPAVAEVLKDPEKRRKLLGIAQLLAGRVAQAEVVEGSGETVEIPAEPVAVPAEPSVGASTPLEEQAEATVLPTGEEVS